MRLKGKVAVIPGGTAGIGREIALAYAREGATVVVASRSKDKVERMAKVFKDMGHNGMSLALDVTNRAQVEDLMKKVVDKYGRIDIMLNSAGWYPATPVLDVSADEWMKVLDLNLTGPFWCAQAAAKYMVKQKEGGSIIFLSSGQGLRGVALMAHYSSAKGGLNALARAMAAELGRFNIRVNSVAVGLTTTETVNDIIPAEFQEGVKMAFPLQRLGKPDDYNGIAILLGSDEGSFITAETIAVDGGTANADAPRM